MSDAQAFSRALQALSARYPEGIGVHLDVMRWWCILVQLQLALRHPANTGPAAGMVREVVEDLGALLAAEEPLKTLFEKGWHEAYDLPPDPGNTR
jgi:hypothetical protein